jgi:hypothetical protein
MTTRTYDAAKVNVSFSGIPLGGFAPDTFLTVERNEDAFTLVVGASGEAARSQSRNRSGRVTLTVMATSQTNDVLSALHNADELQGTGVGALFIKELNGTTLVSAESAWVVKMAPLERGAEVGTVEWVIECESLDTFVGGLIF